MDLSEEVKAEIQGVQLVCSGCNQKTALKPGQWAVPCGNKECGRTLFRKKDRVAKEGE